MPHFKKALTLGLRLVAVYFAYLWTLSVIRLRSFAYSMKAVLIVSLSESPSFVAIFFRISRCSLLRTTRTMSLLGRSWPPFDQILVQFNLFHATHNLIV